ncbi:uncharacterized protein LOC110857716 [Folsomia candida]|uniref:uncharacterized protein LOC110857716 n=1 Tax=Folsomia candida TaxID=158441 RepID=UPI000B8F4CAE|nr:uncharacterized protein LOC110857716 [Folsomia candida]
MELMESIFENELLLGGIFSWLDLDTIKIVRLVNSKYKRVAWKRFSEISHVYVHLHLVLGTDFDNARLQLDLNDQPFLTLELGEDINTALNDQLTPFKNFKLEFTIIQRTLISDRRIEVVYFRLNQLIRHLWRPNGSLIHSLSVLLSSEVGNVSRDLLVSIIQACNSFSHVEIEPKGYVLLNTSDLPRMTCHTLRINYAAFRFGNLSNSFSNFENIKKIILEDASSINLDTVVRAIFDNGEQFRNLEEIDVKIKLKFDQLVALAGLRGLKRLTIRIVAANMSQNTIPALQECVARHSQTLEFLYLQFIRCKVTSGLSFETVFPKLRMLYLETANLTFEEFGDQDQDIYYEDEAFKEVESPSVDIFYLNGAVENGTMRKQFAALQKIEVIEPPDTSHPILKTNNISEFGVKYGIQFVYNGVWKGRS